jgi:nitrite reductase (NO-forming)
LTWAPFRSALGFDPVNPLILKILIRLAHILDLTQRKLTTAARMKRLTCFVATVFISVTFFSFRGAQKFDLKASIDRGKEIYIAQCMSCHLEEGEGIDDVYPPLAKSDYLMADKSRSISNVLHGLSGEITVNGKTYNGEMFAFDMSDEEVSDVLNYIRNSWGNKGGAVTPEEVKAVRK